MEFDTASRSEVRSFVCIGIPDEQRKRIARWLDSRRRESGEVRWVDARVIHITLKFCKEISPSTIGILADNLEHIERPGPFSISLGGIGGFPNLIRPKVIWAGISGETDRLEVLRKQVETAAYRAGIQKETRPYSPHVTLGRRSAADPLPSAVLSAMRDDPLVPDVWTVKEIILMRSLLTPTGPQYTPLGFFKI